MVEEFDSNPKKHLMLIDGSGYIFRAYHALPPLTRSDGLPTGAVHGFCQMLLKLLQDLSDGFRPTHIAVIFDAARKNFRNDIYSDYKANRDEPPDDLKPQFDIIKNAVEAFNIISLQMNGFEADDLIATYAKKAAKEGFKVTIISSDKDLMQLVDDNISMFDTMKNLHISIPQVVEKFAVNPDKLVYLQALAGDSSDNVPGVPGIGPKIAAELVNHYGDLESILENTHEIKQNKRRENLIEFAELARISYKLVLLKDDVEAPLLLDDMKMQNFDALKLVNFLNEYEFRNLANRIADIYNVKAGDIAPVVNHKPTTSFDVNQEGENTPSYLAQKVENEMRAIGFEHDNYETIYNIDDLQNWLIEAENQGYMAFDTETNSLDAKSAEVIGMSLALSPNKACYIPISHKSTEFNFDDDKPVQLELNDVIATLKPYLEDEAIRIIGQNIKFDMLLMMQIGIRLNAIDDTMLLSYALDAGINRHGMDELSQKYFDHKPMSYKELTGTGRNKITFDYVDIEIASKYAAEDADITLRLYEILSKRLIAEKMANMYHTLERPLIEVLADMENEGVLVDEGKLNHLSSYFESELNILEVEIHKIAGCEFNIASPKQLGEILFDKLELPGGKKTKSGTWATDAKNLESLAEQGFELPVKLIEWRQLAKLKSTYSDALPEYINKKSQRVHTSYSLAATTTGRLASTEPNLQNIPIRTEQGRKIRQAFIANEGNKLISADYSQIELKLLAHIADEKSLKQAFLEGHDIHAMTASEMFNVPLDEMSSEVRSRAKAINFGIIYGISAFGLANQLSISRTEAGEYIKSYFERFPAILDYMDQTKEFCRKNGYVKTLFGRKCHYPEINSKNGAMKGFLERAAINAPIQGTAADIIRRAMIKMPKIFKKNNCKSKMLLQVHDELIFETPSEFCEAEMKIIKNTMESAAKPAQELSIPLTVDINTASNWDEAH